MVDAIFVCAHGAGGHKDDRSMLRFANAFPPSVEVVRFNFDYREKGSKRPDPMPLLKDQIRKRAEEKRQPGARLLLGGRSMGGRAASMLVADGYPCDGLILAAYPLHPAGQPGKLRDAHLPAIKCPVLCLNGTRDALCDRDLMEPVVAKLGSNWTMHWLDGADHSFNVLKSSGRTNADVDEEVRAAIGKWGLSPFSRPR